MYCLLASNPKKKKRMKEAVWGMDDLRGCGKRPSTRQRSKSTDQLVTKEIIIWSPARVS